MAPTLLGAVLLGAAFSRALTTTGLSYPLPAGFAALLLGVGVICVLPLQPLGVCRGGGWRALAAVVASLAGAAATLQTTSPYLLLEGLLALAPLRWAALSLVAFAARASASTRPLARTRVLVVTAIALLALAAFAEHAAFELTSSHPPPRFWLLFHCWRDGSAAASWLGALAAGCLLVGASRGRPGIRAVLAVSGAACLATSVARVFDVAAADGLTARARGMGPAWDDFVALSPLATIAVAVDAFLAVLVGTLGALAVARAARDSVGARRVWRVVLPAVLLMGWLSSAGAMAALSRSVRAHTPAVSAMHGVQPLVREGPLAFPFHLRSPVWVVDANGERIGHVPGDAGEHDPLRILADHRAPLARIAAYARALPRAPSLQRARLVLRSSSTQALDALAPTLRSRFLPIDMLARAGVSMPLRVGTEADLGECEAGQYDCPTRQCTVSLDDLASARIAACERGVERMLVLDRISANATLDAVANGVDAVFVVEREGDTGLEPGAAPVIDDLNPTAEGSPFGTTALIALVLGLAYRLARARLRWPSRIPIGATLAPEARPAGEVTPSWLARSACDCRVVPPESGTYRTGRAPIALATGRSFGRGVATTVLSTLRAWAPGLAASAVIAAVLWRMAGLD